MNDDELLQLLSDPKIPPEQKQRAWAAKNRKAHQTDWWGTGAALAADAGAGALVMQGLQRWGPKSINHGWKKDVLGGVLGGGAMGLATIYGLNALRNKYEDPLEQT